MKAGVKFVVLKLQQKHVLHSFVKCECQKKCVDIHVFYLGSKNSDMQ